MKQNTINETSRVLPEKISEIMFQLNKDAELEREFEEEDSLSSIDIDFEVNKEFEEAEIEASMEDNFHAYLKEISKYEQFTKEEEIEAFKRLESGDESAYDEIFTRNLKLVIYVAKRYFSIKNSFEPMDIVMDGNIGLMTAIQRFDYRKGFKFSTYAINWIKQSIQRSLHNYGTIVRLPVHINESYTKYISILTKAEMEGNPRPSDEELVKLLNINMDKLKLLYQIENRVRNVASLNMPIGDNADSNDASELMEILEDIEAKPIDDMIIQQELSELINEVINRWAFHVNPKRVDDYTEIVKRRFGLQGYESETLDSVGKRFGVTRERIRQLEQSFVKFARTSRDSKYLKEYLIK